MELSGATVIITGASSGIGAAAAHAFAAAGAHVVLAARNREKLEHIAAELPGLPLVVPTDVSQPDEVEKLVTYTLAERGKIDILVNNAGIGVVGPMAEVSIEDMQQVMQVNLFAPLVLIQSVLPHMKHQQHGQIINVSSVVGLKALPFAGGYAASKAALDRVTDALRMELRGSGIVVTLVRPGTTRTKFFGQQLGVGQVKRRFLPEGVSADVVAKTLVRAARDEPRVAYVTWRDRAQVGLTFLIPNGVERFLTWAFQWQRGE